MEKTIVLKVSEALGDTIILTRLLKSMAKSLDTNIKVRINPNRRIFLEGIVNQENGFKGELVEPDYAPKRQELQVDVSCYLDMPSNSEGINYSETMLQLAEEQIRRQIGDNIFKLMRDVKTEICFDTEKYRTDIETGKKKVKELRKKYGKKPIIWFGTMTKGSINRMPQSHEGKENFWQELYDTLKEKGVLYELRSPNTKPIAEGVEPLEGENFSFPANSEIIKITSAGIGLDGMQVEWAYALGKPKMVILLGPTHPRAMIYPGEEKTMLTIPSTSEVESYKNRCWGCGNLGYSSFESFEERRRVMQKRFQGFEFDAETQKALNLRNEEALANTQIRCRKLKHSKHLYDCWDELFAEKVASQLEKLL